ncbi:MAG: aspartate kinase [Alphaproteobacteria bacterium]
MAHLVLKFGGTSVGSLERMRHVAQHVKRERDQGHHVAVVVSAMAGETNRLVDLTRDAASAPDAREIDMVVSTGEQVSAGLFAMVLQDAGVPARSYSGWQLPFKTDGAHGRARILEIDVAPILEGFQAGEVGVLTGFQGVDPDGRVTTLGRGGSDTSAVALAGALKADRCDIYTDVDGVYTTDPRIVPKARKLNKISYEEMLEMASLGAKVLQTRSVEIAMVHRVRLQVLPSFAPPHTTPAGTLVCDEDDTMEKQVVSGIAYSKDEAKVTLAGVPDEPGVAARIFGALADAHVNVDMIVQNVSIETSLTDLTFTMPEADLPRVRQVLETAWGDIGYRSLIASADVTKISVIGVGMRSHAGVAQKMFKTLAERGINILVITTSEIKISVLIEAEYTELAMRTLHTAYGLETAVP